MDRSKSSQSKGRASQRCKQIVDLQCPCVCVGLSLSPRVRCVCVFQQRDPFFLHRSSLLVSRFSLACSSTCDCSEQRQILPAPHQHPRSPRRSKCFVAPGTVRLVAHTVGPASLISVSFRFPFCFSFALEPRSHSSSRSPSPPSSTSTTKSALS